MKKRKCNKLTVFTLLMIMLFSNMVYAVNYTPIEGFEDSYMSIPVTNSSTATELKVTHIGYNKSNDWVQVTMQDNSSPMLASQRDWLEDATNLNFVITSDQITNISVSLSGDELIFQGYYTNKSVLPSFNINHRDDFVGSGTMIFSRTLNELNSMNFDGGDTNASITHPEVLHVLSLFQNSNVDEDELIERGIVKSELDFKYFYAVAIRNNDTNEASRYDFVLSTSPIQHLTSTGTFDVGINDVFYRLHFSGVDNKSISELTSSDIYSAGINFVNGSNIGYSDNITTYIYGFENSSFTSQFMYSNYDLTNINDEIIQEGNIINEPPEIEIPYLHNITRSVSKEDENYFSFIGTVDSREITNKNLISFDSDLPLSVQYQYTSDYDDYSLHYYKIETHSDQYGLRDIEISMNYGGITFLTNTFSINNTSTPLPNAENDIFYLRTLDNYIDFVLETNSKNLYQEVDAYRLLDNSNQATVKEFPSYYKRFEEELDGYSQPRYRYTFRFPSESFESEMFLRGQIDFSDGTQMTSNNMIDYQLKTWGDTGEYVQDSPIYDNLPDIDNEQVNDTINDAKTTYTQTVQEMEQSPFGQKMKAFFGANWLLMLIGIIVFVVVLWG